MKSLGIVSGSVALLIGTVAVASAAEPSASISKASLGSMGLGSMQPMSEDEGLGVRGKGVFFGGFDMKGKAKLHSLFPKKKVHHRKGFDFKVVHKKDFRFDHKKDFRFSHKTDFKFSHKGFDSKFGHKTFGGGMLWQPKKMVGNFGGGIKLY